MLNIYEGIRDHPGYNKLAIGEFLFAEHTCGIENKKLPLWTRPDFRRE